MKNLKLILAGTIVLFLSFGMMAQTDPPDPPGEHGSDQDQHAGAPLSGGLLILLSAGLAYGGKKLYALKKENKAELED